MKRYWFMVSVSPSNHGCNWEVAKHSRSYSRVALAIIPCDFYSSFVLSNPWHASIAQQTHTSHEPIKITLNVIASNVHENYSTSTQFLFPSREDYFDKTSNIVIVKKVKSKSKVSSLKQMCQRAL